MVVNISSSFVILHDWWFELFRTCCFAFAYEKTQAVCKGSYDFLFTCVHTQVLLEHLRLDSILFPSRINRWTYKPFVVTYVSCKYANHV